MVSSDDLAVVESSGTGRALLSAMQTAKAMATTDGFILSVEMEINSIKFHEWKKIRCLVSFSPPKNNQITLQSYVLLQTAKPALAFTQFKCSVPLHINTWKTSGRSRDNFKTL